MPSTWPIAGRSARVDPSSALNAQATPSGPSAVRRPSAPRFAIQPGSARIRSVSSAPLPPTSSGCSRIAAAIGSGVVANSAAIPESVSRERRHAAAVDGDVCRADELGDPLLQRMRELAIRVERPAVCAAGGQHPRVLARAVVPERAVGAAVLRAALQVVDARRRRARAASAPPSSCAGSAWCDALAIASSSVVEVVVALEQRHRLDRLQRRAQEAVDVLAERRPVRRPDVHAVHRLDDIPALHGYPDRVHARGGA